MPPKTTEIKLCARTIKLSEGKSYSQILRSVSVIGGSAVIVMLIGLIRIKFAAILIGAAGVGLIASFTAIQVLIATISGFGINSSAVREISRAAGKDDQQGVNQSITTLCRFSFIAGLSGMCFVIMLSPVISKLNFGEYNYTLEIAVLGFTVMMSNLSSANMAILQGLRRVNEMARANTYGAAIGAVCAIICFYLMKLRGVVPALLLTGLAQYVVSRYFVRHQLILIQGQTWRQIYVKGRPVLRLGFTFMWSAFLVSLVNYTAVFLVNKLGGVQLVGVYTAALSLSGIFVGFVLTAMSADYYPRLTAAANDKIAMIELVTEQLEIGLLLAVPGLLGCIVFAPWLVEWFYSKEFSPAVPMLQWFILGCLGRVISWPMGFIILALGKDRLFFVTETIFSLVHCSAIAISLWLFGINGIAFAFGFAYVVYAVGMYIVSQRLIGFTASYSCVNLVFTSVAIMSVGLFISRQFQLITATILGAFLVVISLIYSLRGLFIRINR